MNYPGCIDAGLPQSQSNISITVSTSDSTCQCILPKYSTYRLGPIDGSPCDTLGIDNVPEAWFRVDSTGLQQRFFFDLSYYNPLHWQ